MLYNWTKHQVYIVEQKWASRWGRSVIWKGRELVIEHALFREFEEGRRIGKAIGARWFKRHARALYRQQHLHRVSQNALSRRLTYDKFKFSNG
jgi:hypothetical protein